MIFSRVSWRQTWPNHDSLRRLTVKDIDLLPYIFVCFMLSVWHAKGSPVAFVFKGRDSPLQIRRRHPALTSIEQYWQDKWFVEFKLCCYLLALSWLSVLAPVWSELPLLMFRFGLCGSEVSEVVHFYSVLQCIDMLVDGRGLMLSTRTLSEI